jgi:hypothetical protein
MRARISLALGLATLAVTLLGSMSTAHAQYGAPPPYGPPPGYGPPPYRGVYRQGLIFGGALGVGAIELSQCNVCGASAFGELHLGGMINPRLAVMAELWGGGRNFTDPQGFTGDIENVFFGPAIQYWITDIIWIKGGVGGARRQVNYDGNLAPVDDRTALGLTGAGGIEVLQTYNFALDLSFYIGDAFYSDTSTQNYAFMVGVNWY